MRGHGPRCGDAARTKSPHSRAGARAHLEHALERLVDVRRRAVRQAGDHRAGGERLRVGGEHDGRHGSAGGQAGDEDAAGRDAVIADHRIDHLPDRQRLAPAALDVAGEKPVEALVRIVRGLLLRQHEREAVAIRERRPARPEIVAGRRLRTAVQHHHQRRFRPRRHVFEHAQRPRVRPEPVDFGQMAERGIEVRRRRAGLHELFPLAAIAGEVGDRASEALQAAGPCPCRSLLLNNQYAGLLLRCTIAIVAEIHFISRHRSRNRADGRSTRPGRVQPSLFLVPATGFEPVTP